MTSRYLIDLQQRKSKIIHVYRNGDKYSRASLILLRPVEQKELERIFKAVEEKITLPNNKPIRRMFTLEGVEINEPVQIVDQKYYVVGSFENFVNTQYGSVLKWVIIGPVRWSKFQEVTYESPVDVGDLVSSQKIVLKSKRKSDNKSPILLKMTKSMSACPTERPKVKVSRNVSAVTYRAKNAISEPHDDRALSKLPGEYINSPLRLDSDQENVSLPSEPISSDLRHGTIEKFLNDSLSALNVSPNDTKYTVINNDSPTSNDIYSTKHLSQTLNDDERFDHPHPFKSQENQTHELDRSLTEGVLCDNNCETNDDKLSDRRDTYSSEGDIAHNDENPVNDVNKGLSSSGSVEVEDVKINSWSDDKLESSNGCKSIETEIKTDAVLDGHLEEDNNKLNRMINEEYSIDESHSSSINNNVDNLGSNNLADEMIENNADMLHQFASKIDKTDNELLNESNDEINFHNGISQLDEGYPAFSDTDQREDDYTSENNHLMTNDGHMVGFEKTEELNFRHEMDVKDKLIKGEHHSESRSDGSKSPPTSDFVKEEKSIDVIHSLNNEIHVEPQNIIRHDNPYITEMEINEDVNEEFDNLSSDGSFVVHDDKLANDKSLDLHDLSEDDSVKARNEESKRNKEYCSNDENMEQYNPKVDMNVFGTIKEEYSNSDNSDDGEGNSTKEISDQHYEDNESDGMDRKVKLFSKDYASTIHNNEDKDIYNEIKGNNNNNITGDINISCNDKILHEGDSDDGINGLKESDFMRQQNRYPSDDELNSEEESSQKLNHSSNNNIKNTVQNNIIHNYGIEADTKSDRMDDESISDYFMKDDDEKFNKMKCDDKHDELIKGYMKDDYIHDNNMSDKDKKGDDVKDYLTDDSMPDDNVKSDSMEEGNIKLNNKYDDGKDNLTDDSMSDYNVRSGSMKDDNVKLNNKYESDIKDYTKDDSIKDDCIVDDEIKDDYMKDINTEFKNTKDEGLQNNTTDSMNHSNNEEIIEDYRKVNTNSDSMENDEIHDKTSESDYSDHKIEDKNDSKYDKLDILRDDEDRSNSYQYEHSFNDLSDQEKSSCKIKNDDNETSFQYNPSKSEDSDSNASSSKYQVENVESINIAEDSLDKSDIDIDKDENKMNEDEEKAAIILQKNFRRHMVNKQLTKDFGNVDGYESDENEHRNYCEEESDDDDESDNENNNYSFVKDTTNDMVTDEILDDNSQIDANELCDMFATSKCK